MRMLLFDAMPELLIYENTKKTKINNSLFRNLFPGSASVTFIALHIRVSWHQAFHDGWLTFFDWPSLPQQRTKIQR